MNSGLIAWKSMHWDVSNDSHLGVEKSDEEEEEEDVDEDDGDE